MVSPDGLIIHQGLRLGLFLIPKQHHYTHHLHRADEVSIMLTGKGSGSLEKKEFTEKGPGDIIDVPSLKVHAIQTGPDSALML